MENAFFSSNSLPPQKKGHTADCRPIRQHLQISIVFQISNEFENRFDAFFCRNSIQQNGKCREYDTPSFLFLEKYSIAAVATITSKSCLFSLKIRGVHSQIIFYNFALVSNAFIRHFRMTFCCALICFIKALP